MIYLQFTYTTGPESGQSDYIGPFETHNQAAQHRSENGPLTGVIIEADQPTSVTTTITPAEHIGYLSERW